MKQLKYRGAGTVEYLYVEEEKKFYFIEMNTRIQVEHTITEEVTDKDIIKAQIMVDYDGEIGFAQDDVVLNGHAIEARINAEDPMHNFRPSPGKIEYLHFGLGRNVRIDSHLYTGYSIPAYYDSMVTKLVVRDKNSAPALAKLKLVNVETVIEQIKTNLDLQYFILQHQKKITNN